MPEVSVWVELRVVVGPDADPVALERSVAAEGRRGARELFSQALASLEDQILPGAGSKQRREPRWMATSVGRIRLHRYRVRTAQGSYHPLDEAMGLSGAEASAGLRELVCDLAMRLPYRQVAEITARVSGEAFSARSAWSVLQEEGARVRTEEDRLVSSIFELGEAPPQQGPRHELVVIEADGTFLRAQREQHPSFEVKTGVFYTAKTSAGGKRHRRWRLLDKGCYATSADADAFGKGLAARGFQWVGLHRASHVLAVHDGLDQFGQTFHDWFPGAIHQVDHFHLAERLWQACGADPARFARLREAGFTDPVALARRIERGTVAVHGHRAEELAGYLRGIAPDLHGIERLPRDLRQGRMHIVGSGVVEKHQDLLVKRRMKGQGMRWTRRGADNLLALQARRFSKRWPATWGVRPAA